jgi:protein O-GlcNAc transferase
MRPAIPLSNADRARQAFGLIEQGKHKAAERVLKDILRAEPNQADALLGLGVLAGMRGNDAEAVRLLSRAAQRGPRLEAAHYNLGQALLRLGRHAEAVEALTAAVALADRVAFHEKLGDGLRQLGRLEEAGRHYARAVELEGRRAGGMLLSSLVETKRRICDWEGLAQIEARLCEKAAGGDPVEPLTMRHVSDDAMLLKASTVGYATGFLPAMVGQPVAGARFRHAPRARERLRVGYLCSDFRNHATAYLMAGVFEAHDRARQETIALSFGLDEGSAMRRRLECSFDRFVELQGMAAEPIAKRIHGLGIDVLVDLNGYIANARPELVMARAAPVQCHYLAFPGTLGSPAIDYQIVDPVIAPPGSETQFAEAIVRLPACYQPNDTRREVAAERPSRAACGLPERGVVLASFNNTLKLSPDVFGIWMRVLAAVPDSVLWLYADNETAHGNIRRAAASAGIAPERIVLARYASAAEHMARLANADLLLDCFPYGAHTTASDALWMGVPVLTQAGCSFASRVGASLVTAAGVPELIATSSVEYETRAIALGSDPGRLDALKARIAAQRSTCALFDTAGIARHLEAAYAEMWRRWSAGERPASFDVSAL